MFNVLVVEDDKNLKKLMVTYLKKNNYSTFEASNGEEALDIIDKQYIDLVISDIMMPKMDGYELLNELRACNYETPIMLITAKGDINDKKQGFLLGADDYMVKPINMEEMILRVEVLLKRAKSANKRKIKIGDLIIDYDQMTVIKHDKVYNLAQKEFFLLYKLISTPNTIFSRQELIEEIWGLESESDYRTVDVHIKRLREKLSDLDEFEIQTVRGVGYKCIINKFNVKERIGIKNMKKTLQRRLVFELSIAIITVILLSALGLYLFTHNALSQFLTISIDSASEEKELWDIFKLGIGIIIVNTVLISYAIIKISSKTYAEPLKKSIEATKKVAAGDFSVRLETKREDETKDLVDNFNRMIKQLEETEIFQKDFIDNVSHEIKTPINSIQGFAKLLDDNDLSESDRKEYVDIILEETSRLLNLSNNILKLASLQHQDKIINVSEINLSSQIKKVVLLLEPKWKKKNINFAIDLNDVYFYGDEDLLFQLWTNLIDNAIKFSNENGNIVVSINTNSDNKIEIKIKDNGIGMDKDELEMIYRRFYQIDKSHSGEGSGLGLSIVKRIVELSNGEIKVDSEKGKGTTFTVTLPVVDKTKKIII